MMMGSNVRSGRTLQPHLNAWLPFFATGSDVCRCFVELQRTDYRGTSIVRTVAKLRACAEIITSCSGLLIAAGAGMGVDSGLPDFRGSEGFWQAYPALKNVGINFMDIANPASFNKRPELAWGFYGHRLELYRDTQPHQGFQILKEIGEALPDGYFVHTSNVDGQFQKAGFDPERISEVHGSIHWLQCCRPCSGRLWSADHFEPEIDESRCVSTSPLPRCPNCGALARPNILMFDDDRWLSARSEFQAERLAGWRRKAASIAIIELGAGTAIPTVRRPGESWGYPLIRVNPREPGVRKSGDVALAMGALDFLKLLAAELASLKGNPGAH